MYIYYPGVAAVMAMIDDASYAAVTDPVILQMYHWFASF